MECIQELFNRIHFEEEHNRNLCCVKFIKNKNIKQIKSFCAFVKNNYELDVYDKMYNNLCPNEKKYLDVIASFILKIVSSDNSLEILELYYRIVDIYEK